MKRPIIRLISAIALGLATALVPAPAHAAAEPAGAPAATEYAALGDSYAAGYGIAPRFELSGMVAQLCARSSKAYPVRLDDNQVSSPNFDFAACSGAVTTDILHPQVLDMAGDTAPAQDAALGAGTDVVTLTIGGNDVGFGDAGRCLQNPVPACAGLSMRVAAGLAALAAPGTTVIPDPISGRTVTVTGLPTVLGDLLARAPQAEIYVSNYPMLLAECGPDYESVNQANLALNNVIDQVVTAMGAMSPRVHLVDAATAFAGHDVCSSEPWISSTNLHPTIAGQVGYANAFRAAMRSAG